MPSDDITASHQAPEAPQTAARALSGLRVLVIAEPARADHLAAALTGGPLTPGPYASELAGSSDAPRIGRAASAAEGLALAVAEPPDVLLVDAALRGSAEGTLLVDVLRADPRTREIPLLAVERAGGHDALLWLKDDAMDVVREPIEPAEVRARIARLLHARRTRALLEDAIGWREADLVELAAEVARRQGELARAEQAAARADGIKSTFLRMMSHELKTPITALRIQIDLLTRGRTGPRDRGLETGLGRIDRASRRLVQLVDTMVAWARVEGGDYPIEARALDLREVAAAVVEDVADFAALKVLRLELDVGTGPPLSTDPTLLRLLLVHLLSRAIGVSAERGRVGIGARWQDSEWCELRVWDSGPTIPIEQHLALFDPLEQGREFGRGGAAAAGLYVARDLARAIDAQVSIEPRITEEGNVVAVSLRGLAPERTTARISVLPPAPPVSRSP